MASRVRTSASTEPRTKRKYIARGTYDRLIPDVLAEHGFIADQGQIIKALKAKLGRRIPRRSVEDALRRLVRQEKVHRGKGDPSRRYQSKRYVYWVDNYGASKVGVSYMKPTHSVTKIAPPNTGPRVS
jgi:hypothetical protein